MMVAIVSAFLQLGHPFVKRAQAINDAGVLSDIAVICLSTLISVSSWRSTIAVSTLMSSRKNAISWRIRRCWAARNSRVTVSGIAAGFGEPAEMGGDLDHSV